MKETGLLNIEISDAIAHLGHMDQLIYPGRFPPLGKRFELEVFYADQS